MTDQTDTLSGAPEPLTLGWEEWLSLPDLGLPAMRAKVDTGAKTSALHAFDIESFGSATRPRVRFTVHPIPGREDLIIPCSAEIVDRREVTSSNGETEMRYVIESALSIGGQSWPIELTLTDRRTMNTRMLLGRQALIEHVTVSPNDRFCQPKLSYDVYHSTKIAQAAPRRALRVAVLSREDNYSTRRLVEEGESRGHSVEVIDTARCYMAINALAPEVHYDGKRLPRYDAVIPRIGASITSYGTAITRQFETIGTYCVNGSQGITASRDKLYAHQLMAKHKIGMPVTAFASSPKDTGNLMGLVGAAPLIVKLLESTQGKGVVLAETKKAAESVIDAFRGLKANFLVQQFVKEAAGEDIRCLVIDGKVVASMKRTGADGDFRSNLHRGGSAKAVRITKEERETAIRATRAFGLGLAGVDLLRSSDGPKVLEVNSSPGFEGIEKASGKDIAGLLFDAIEMKVRPNPVRRRKTDSATEAQTSGPTPKHFLYEHSGNRTGPAMTEANEHLEGAPLIKPSTTDHELYDSVVEACRTVFDPEIPVNIYDLGLIYTILISPENEVRITMTLTAPGCPVAGEMPGWIADAVSPIPGVKDVDIEMVFDPPWGMDMMSDEARLELGFM